MSTEAPRRERILSVTLDDCDVQTFRVGGNGGQKVNKTSSGVRVIHRASGARGESRDTRSQHSNKRTAFIRMTETPTFKAWLAVACGRVKSDAQLNAEIENDLAKPGRVRVEFKQDGRWVEA